MNWTVILNIAMAVVQAMMENCPEQSRETRRGILKNREERFQRRFAVRMQRECCNPFTGCMSRREWREHEDEILNTCYAHADTMDDWELDQICDGLAA